MLEQLIKALELINALKPIIDSALTTEATRRGLSREELHALTKSLIDETDDITRVDMGGEEESDDPGVPQGPGE